MNKKDVLEIKRRLKTKECTFTKMSGCYVNANKEKVVSFFQDFRDLDEEEFHKYLDIANKVLSGTIGNNLLKLDFSKDAEEPLGPKQVLLGIRESGLTNEELLENFYQHVIDNFYYTGNYLILLFKDIYDIPLKTSDNMKTDESEEVYDYMLCAVCPVDLSKPGLGYLKDENKIGSRVRDWVVGMPEIGFVYPLFDERSANIHSTLFYTKNTKEPHDEFMSQVLGCGQKRTTNEKKEVFKNIVIKASENEDKGLENFTVIQGGLKDIVDLTKAEETESFEPEKAVLSKESILSLADLVDIPKELTERIASVWDENINEELEPPVIEDIVDKKLAKEAKNSEEKRELVKENADLKKKIAVYEKTDDLKNEDEERVIVSVSRKKAQDVTVKMIDGEKFVVIPVDDVRVTYLNGEVLE